jgi:hypothetical protein
VGVYPAVYILYFFKLLLLLLVIILLPERRKITGNREGHCGKVVGHVRKLFVTDFKDI